MGGLFSVGDSGSPHEVLERVEFSGNVRRSDCRIIHQKLLFKGSIGGICRRFHLNFRLNPSIPDAPN